MGNELHVLLGCHRPSGLDCKEGQSWYKKIESYCFEQPFPQW